MFKVPVPTQETGIRWVCGTRRSAHHHPNATSADAGATPLNQNWTNERRTGTGGGGKKMQMGNLKNAADKMQKKWYKNANNANDNFTFISYAVIQAKAKKKCTNAGRRIRDDFLKKPPPILLFKKSSNTIAQIIKNV